MANERLDLFGHDKNESQGFGDTISKVIKSVTRGKVEECDGCGWRRRALNRVLPYRKSTKRDNGTR